MARLAHGNVEERGWLRPVAAEKAINGKSNSSYIFFILGACIGPALAGSIFSP